MGGPLQEDVPGHFHAKHSVPVTRARSGRSREMRVLIAAGSRLGYGKWLIGAGSDRKHDPVPKLNFNEKFYIEIKLNYTSMWRLIAHRSKSRHYLHEIRQYEIVQCKNKVSVFAKSRKNYLFRWKKNTVCRNFIRNLCNWVVFCDFQQCANKRCIIQFCE